MKKSIAGLLMLLMLCFSVTIALSAADLESTNPVVMTENQTETTIIYQEVEGIELIYVENAALIAVPPESMIYPNINNIVGNLLDSCLPVSRWPDITKRGTTRIISGFV